MNKIIEYLPQNDLCRMFMRRYYNPFFIIVEMVTIRNV